MLSLTGIVRDGVSSVINSFSFRVVSLPQTIQEHLCSSVSVAGTHAYAASETKNQCYILLLL